MDFFQRFGQFGNANYHYEKDWVSILVEDEFASKFGSKTWIEANNTCQLYSNIDYLVTYAKTGFTQRPQQYIVNTQKMTDMSTWQFNRKADADKQYFSLGVSIQFVELDPSEALSKGELQAEPTPIPPDFFYPFIVRSSAIDTIVGAAVAVLLLSAI